MLKFGNVQTTAIQYKQFHVRVAVDLHQENSHSTGIKPKRTPESEREEKRSSSMKTGRTRSVAPTMTIGLAPKVTLGGSSTWTNEETTGSEKKQYNSRITQQELYGVVWWDFNIDDLNEQEGGIDMSDDILPAVHFEFIGNSDIPAPHPERMDIVITSYWSIIPQSEPKGTWIRKVLHLTKSSGATQAISYSNLCQIVTFKQSHPTCLSGLATAQTCRSGLVLLIQNYESFICKSSFLHSSSWAIKKNIHLGRSLYNTLFRGIGNINYCLRASTCTCGVLIETWLQLIALSLRLNECARTCRKVSDSFKNFLHMHYMY